MGISIERLTQAGKRTEKIHELHKIHGPVVRVGPREVAFNDPAALKDIYAASVRLDRPADVRAFDNYDHPNMFTTNDHVLHGLRRREVSHTYSTANVRTPRNGRNLWLVINNLLTEIRSSRHSSDDGSIEVNSRLHYMACDAMSYFVFGPERVLNLLGDTSQRHLIHDRISSGHFRKLLLHGWYPGMPSCTLRLTGL